MGAFLVDRLAANSDPRLPFYSSDVDVEGTVVGYVGSSPNTEDANINASILGPYLNGTAQPVPMVTYEEAKFLEAEALLRNNNPGGAAQAYNEGVLASVLAVTGADAPADFVTNHASLAAGDMDLETIMLGKYDALFSQLEVWSDWRRTGFPTLVPNQSPIANDGGIPYRLPTPLDERTTNANYQGVLDLYQKPWFAAD